MRLAVSGTRAPAPTIASREASETIEKFPENGCAGAAKPRPAHPFSGLFLYDWLDLRQRPAAS